MHVARAHKTGRMGHSVSQNINIDMMLAWQSTLVNCEAQFIGTKHIRVQGPTLLISIFDGWQGLKGHNQAIFQPLRSSTGL